MDHVSLGAAGVTYQPKPVSRVSWFLFLAVICSFGLGIWSSLIVIDSFLVAERNVVYMAKGLAFLFWPMGVLAIDRGLSYIHPFLGGTWMLAALVFAYGPVSMRLLGTWP